MDIRPLLEKIYDHESVLGEKLHNMPKLEGDFLELVHYIANSRERTMCLTLRE
jgi:hypothetical protein